MKISKIELYQIDLPYSGGTYLLSSGRTYESFDASILKITTDDGIVGWGETTPFGSTYIAAHALGARAGIEELAPSMLGRDPRQVDRNLDFMNSALVGHNHAKTPFDLACWDIFGKSVDLPAYELLGGSTGNPLPMISSIHAGEPEEMRVRVADHRSRGYKGHSIKIGTLDSAGGPALDAARIEACLADKQPGEFFLVDANGGLIPETALRLFSLLKPGLDFVLEAPCATWAETASLRHRSPYPIVLDELAQTEADVLNAAATDVAVGIGLKISKAGGLTAGRRQRDICRAGGLTISVQDTVGSAIAFAGILQLGATVPEQNLRCVLNCADMVTVETGTIDAQFTAEGVLPGRSPGLGITVKEDVLGSPVATWQ